MTEWARCIAAGNELTTDAQAAAEYFAEANIRLRTVLEALVKRG